MFSFEMLANLVFVTSPYVTLDSSYVVFLMVARTVEADGVYGQLNRLDCKGSSLKERVSALGYFVFSRGSVSSANQSSVSTLDISAQLIMVSMCLTNDPTLPRAFDISPHRPKLDSFDTLMPSAHPQTCFCTQVFSSSLHRLLETIDLRR